ncbi:High mobility group HMG1 HMG2 [Fasciola hepatica]|uniref:High mobility group HMG1 HMG2 n=1 Tax=Fasciola hepatica TaxID=6192 RepID=A0A4E0R5I2_FASHE|nr:High mobility group HMG1 HMG2 [Fasciola hepatica]
MALCVGQKQTKPETKQKPVTKRPPGPYALFVRSMKKFYTGNLAEFSRYCACEWRQLSEAEREKFRKQAAALSRPKKRSPQSAAYLKFVASMYNCLRRKHPTWPAKRIKEELMKNYQKLKCKCPKNKK